MRCTNCFSVYGDELTTCPHCNAPKEKAPAEPYLLPAGTRLHDRYYIGHAVGIGGFGITYKAWDEKLEIEVAIKEFYMSGVVNRTPGTTEVTLYAKNKEDLFVKQKSRFLDEARNLAKFNNHSNIVHVYEFFEENGTAYFTMEYLVGRELGDYMAQGGVTLRNALDIINKVCQALKAIHAKGILHRDISPDNIFICANGSVKVLDLGAARLSKAEDRKLTKIIKPGYAPKEQYESVNPQGPWTDIYALGATMYLMLTGVKPMESTDRVEEDTLKSPSELNPNIPVYISNTVMKAMAVDYRLRFQSVEEFEQGLGKKKKVATIAEEKKKRKRKRNFGIAIAIALLACCGVFLWWQWMISGNLEGEITVWVMTTEDEEYSKAKLEAFQQAADAFVANYPEVTVTIEGITEVHYQEMLETALENGDAPDVFERSEMSVKYATKLADVTTIFESENAKSCVYLAERKSEFVEASCVPLGFDLMAAYINTNLMTWDEEEVSDLTELKAVDRSDEETFLLGKSACLVSYTSRYWDVKEAIPGRYKMLPVTDPSTATEFSYIFSATAEEENISTQFLQFLLSDKAQDYLHVQHTSHLLPIQSTTLDVMIEVYPEFAPFSSRFEDGLTGR